MVVVTVKRQKIQFGDVLHLQGTRNDSWVAVDAYRLEKDATGCKKKYFRLRKLNALV